MDWRIKFAKSPQVCILVFLQIVFTIQEPQAYNNFDQTDAEVLRRDLLIEALFAPGTNAPVSPGGYYAGPYDLQWSKYDSLNFDLLGNAKLQVLNTNPTKSACAIGLLPLPSGGLYCRMSASLLKNFADSNDFCKSKNFTGLLETKTRDDEIYVAGFHSWLNYGNSYPKCDTSQINCFDGSGLSVVLAEKDFENTINPGPDRWIGATYNDALGAFTWLSDGSPVNTTSFMDSGPPLKLQSAIQFPVTDGTNSLLHITLKESNVVSLAAGYWDMAQNHLEVINALASTDTAKLICYKNVNDVFCGSNPMKISPMFFSKRPCGQMMPPTNTKISQLRQFDFTDKNFVVKCNKQNVPSFQTNTLTNTLTLRKLPRLKRPILSFHHACGLIASSLTEDCPAAMCSIQVSSNSFDNENYNLTSTDASLQQFLSEVPASETFNDGSLSSVTSWNAEEMKLPPIQKNSRLLVSSSFDLLLGGVGLDNVALHTRQKCLPRWSMLKGFMFNANIEKNLRAPMSEFENTGINPADLDNKYYMASTVSVLSLEYCSRLCLIGSNCDMFEYTATTGSCRFFPHQPLKSENLFRVITRDTTNQSSIFTLQCSTPFENILKNSDLFTHSYSGWTVNTNCLDYGITDEVSSPNSKSSVNGLYEFRHYTHGCPLMDCKNGFFTYTANTSTWATGYFSVYFYVGTTTDWTLSFILSAPVVNIWVWSIGWASCIHNVCNVSSGWKISMGSTLTIYIDVYLSHPQPPPSITDIIMNGAHLCGSSNGSSAFSAHDVYYYNVSQEVQENDLPYGINSDYLNQVQPVAILRTWGTSTSPSSSLKHQLSLNVDFLSGGNVDATKSQLWSDTFPERGGDADDKEFSYFIKNFTGFDSISVSQTLTLKNATSAFLLPGPMELLLDVPMEVGCFVMLAPSTFPSGTTTSDSLTPAACILNCLNSEQRFALLINGDTCSCFSDLPLSEMFLVREDLMCNTPCTGDTNYLCGGSIAASIYVATCPLGQIRYGDSCYMLASQVDTDILSAVDICASQNAALWYPESSNEITFILDNFPSKSGYYYVGIEEYLPERGIVFSDNSYSVGLPFLIRHSILYGGMGESLDMNQYILSPGQCYKLTLETDGNLVLRYAPQNFSFWFSNTGNTGSNIAVMQKDGNFVVYSGSTAKWLSKTHGNTNAYLTLEDNGNLNIFSSAGVLIWSTWTAWQKTYCKVMPEVLNATNCIRLKASSKNLNFFNFCPKSTALCKSKLVNGQGYQSVISAKELIVRSSLSSRTPTPFSTSKFPIFVQLENDMTTPKRYVDVFMAKQIVISALLIETPLNKALISFSLSYVERGIEFPNVFTTFLNLQDDTKIFYMKRSPFDNTSSIVISRRIDLPRPITTDRLKLVVESGLTPLVLKMDFVGLDPVRKYQSDPMLDPLPYKDYLGGATIDAQSLTGTSQLTGQNICPGGSIYLRITPLQYTLGLISLSVTVGSGPPSTLKILLSLNPFKITVAGTPSYQPVISPMPNFNVPMDFVIACSPETFKIFINGQLAVGTISTYHQQRDPITQTIIPPTVTGISYNIATGAAGKGMNIGRISWTYTPTYGILSTIAQLSSASPPSTNLTTFMKDQSTLVGIYQVSNGTETRYHPVQALQNCFRNGQGNIKCNTVEGIYESPNTQGFGGNSGIGAIGCADGYFGVGKQCVYFPTMEGPPTGTGGGFQESVANCSQHASDVLYIPMDATQNTVMKAALTLWGIDKVWINIYLDSGGIWRLPSGNPVDAFVSDWAANEPSESEDSICAAMFQSVGYQWKTVLCNDPSIKSICMARSPDCPYGYTWLYQMGQTCVKVSSPVNQVIGTYSDGEHPAANAFCAQENTRLAAAETLSEMNGLYQWIKNYYTLPGQASYMLGYRIFDSGTSLTMETRNDMVTQSSLNASMITFSGNDNCAIFGSGTGISQSKCSISNQIVYALCEYIGGTTVDGTPCVFPFRYKNRLYDRCITLGNNGVSWCATGTNNLTFEMTSNQWWECQPFIKVNDCPVGFRWLYSEGTCYRYTNPLPKETVTSFETAEAKCIGWGGRLFQPRSTNSFSYFPSAEQIHLGDELFRFLKSGQNYGLIAIGMFYMQNTGDSTSYFYYRDGTKVQDFLSNFLQTLWDSGYPKADGGNCIALKKLKLVNTPCNNSAKTYYDRTTGADPVSAQTPLLGYLCETRPIPTLNDDMCYFPFQYQGKTYVSCSYVNNTVLNSQGAPWCATDSSFSNLALCQDERTIIYSGNGSGNFCPMPFLYNREYFDMCTRKSSSQPTGFESYFWCPDPKEVTQQNLFTAGNSIGKCDTFLIPSDNGCNANYDGATSSLCIRVSSYPETYEDGQARCNLEGGQLLQVTNQEINNGISAVISSKIQNIPRFKGIRQMWVGADYSNTTLWQWRGYYKAFKDFTLWESALVNIGCYASGCTPADGLVVRPDTNFMWNAVVDKSKALPYICMSNCTRGYLWIPSVSKCLKVVNSSSTQAVSIGQALMTCSAEQGRLVALKTCDQISSLVQGVYDQYQQPNMTYFVGIFYINSPKPGSVPLRNWEPLPVMDSLGYGLDGLEYLSGSCAMAASAQSFTSITITGQATSFSVNSNPFGPIFNAGYICEQEKHWGCPPGYYMLDMNCYKLVKDLKTFAESEFSCIAEGATLAKPVNRIQNEFLKSLISFNTTPTNLSLKNIWIDYRVENFTFDIFDLSLISGLPSGSQPGANCYAYSINISGLIQAPPIQNLFCSDKAYFICQIEQSLPQIYQPYLPSPIGIWPFSKSLGAVDVGQNSFETNESWIAYDPLYTPIGISGSAMFTKELMHKSFISIYLNKISIPKSNQISILGWIRPDADVDGTIFSWYLESPEVGLQLRIQSKQLKLTIYNTNESFSFFGLKSYPLKFGKWSFFAVVLDGQSMHGRIQLDYAYGYNNGSIDLKMQEFFIPSFDWYQWLFYAELKLGASPNVTGDSPFDGSMSCFQLYDMALSPNQLQYKMNCRDAVTSSPNPCPNNYKYFDGTCLQVSTSSSQYPLAEVSCMPSLTDSHRSQLLSPYNRRHIEYAMELAFVNYKQTSIWIGCDDSDGDEQWVDSLGQNISDSTKMTLFYNDSTYFATQCCLYERGLSGYLSSDDCTQRYFSVCETAPLNTPPDYPCPNGYYPYKNNCFNPKQQNVDYDSAVLNCANIGGYPIVIKDKGFFSFVTTWASKIIPMDFWVGLRAKTVTYAYTPASTIQPLVEIVDSRFSYADGTLFDKVGGFLLGTTKLVGECIYLKQSNSFIAADLQCKKYKGYICQWSKPKCPTGYQLMGQLSDGRNCFGSSSTKVTSSTNICPALHYDDLRDRWIPSSPYAADWARRSLGKIWIDGTLIFGGNWTVSDELMITSSYTDLRKTGTWVPAPGDVLNTTGCLELTTTGLFLPQFNSSCNALNPQACEYKACMTKTGKQCIFPFTYRNETSPVLDYNVCSTLDVYKPWCPTVLSSSGDVYEWGECLPDCPQEDVTSVCIMEPTFPAFADGSQGSVNFTSNYVPGSGLPTLDLDYVYFTCPLGYVFEKSNNVTHYAMCRNWKFVHLFDPTKSCVPVACPSPAPNFLPGTPQGVSTWDQRRTNFSTVINYTCPEGYVFQLYQDFPDPTLNFGLIVNETDQLSTTCAVWGNWEPPKLPPCIPKNCTNPPISAPNSDKGMYNWDPSKNNRSFGLSIKYWCPKFGWGFPSTGLSSVINTCRADKTWNLTSWEACVLLPCPSFPPAAVPGGWMWFGTEFTKYKCPNGFYFQSGLYPFSYSNCSELRVWDPPVMEKCVPRSCQMDPPAPWLGIDMDWPMQSYDMGTTVIYTCPFRTTTNSEGLIVQYSHCIWDKDTDEMIWYPSEIDVCNKTIPPTGNILVLPTYPSYAIQYPDTTDYYWPQISVDDPTFFVNSTGKTTPSPITDGPFGFGKAISVSLNKCIVKSHYGILYDTCILDPTNCKDGFSMSIWEKVTFPSEIFNLQMLHPKTTIVSSGGDFDPVSNTSYRGYAIFHEGMDVQAVMVTQYDVYYVNVRGQLLNNSWTNFGFRFIEYINSTTIPYLQRGGLELYINGLKVGQAVVPLDRPIGGWKQGKVLTPIPSDPTWRGIDINPPIIMIGCQRTSADKKFRNFGLQNAAYDELTIWTRRLGTNKSVDETLYFTGGYVPQFDGVAPGDWKNMLKRVELSDPGQQQMAGVITTMMAGVNGGQQTNANYSSGVFNRTLQENVDYNNQILQLETALQLLDMTGLILTPLARAKYLYKRFSVLAAVSTSLAETPTNIAGWGSVHLDPNEPGSSFLLNRTDNYILQYASSANILHDESIPNVYSANRSEFVVHSSSPGLTMSVTKVLPQNFNKYPETIDLARFYSSHKVAPTNQWYNFLETIQIPNSWQFTNNSYCQGQPFTLLTAIYDGYGKLAPNRRAPQFIPSEEFKLDSKAVSVKMKVNPFPNGDLTQNFSQCFLDEVAMKYTPIRIRFYHIDNQTSLRKLLWHENELQTDIALRRCVVYRHDIGLTGAWDTDSCTTVMTDQMSTICECSNFGTFAVEAEYVDPASYGAEFTWVGVVKYMGYIFSLILLVVFFFTIILSTELWDQFHILRCHTSFVCFMALLSMMITEVEFVRTDRHSNIVISIMQQYWFQAFSFFLFSESFATFRAITGGIIGGKTLAYIPISYGMPFICTGLAVYLYGSDFGTDPRAFIGWENATKQVFFYGQLPTASVTLLICLVIVFNLSLPQTRKDSIIDQLANQGNGLSIMAFIFLMTWAFAYPAYIRYPGAEVPDFYPIFIILNSWSGVFIFCLLGIISKPFRAALLGGGGLRSNPLFMYMQTGQKIEDDFKDLSRTPSSTSLASQPDSLDEDIEKGLPEPKEEKKEEPAPEPKKEESDDDSDDSEDSDESDDDDKKDKKKEEEEEDDDDDGDGDLLG